MALLKESGSWAAARLLAGRFFLQSGDKFVTVHRHKRRWIATQWVATSSRPYETAPRVYPGRVGISRHRPRAFRKMVHMSWLLAAAEPAGPTFGLQVYARCGNGGK